MAESSRQWYCVVNGQKYGPISEQELRSWVTQGRVRPTDNVWTDDMAAWQPLQSVQYMFRGGMSLPPAEQPAAKAHRGGVILALGLIGLLACWICGAFAWSMGNTDLQEMRAGIMDRSGEGLTQAGRICGMISVILGILGCCISLLWILIIAGAGASGGF
jgi:ferric-dicitrate binding protein FerR (iron transport regulator)